MSKYPRFTSNRRFKRKDLLFALLNHKSHLNKSGKSNPQYKDGKTELYVRIRVNGFKVPRSHIVWMLWNNKSFVPKDKNIHHKNEHKRDDSISNLELVDHREHGTNNLKNVGKNRNI